MSMMKRLATFLLLVIFTSAHAWEMTQREWNAQHLWQNLNLQIAVRPETRGARDDPQHWIRVCVMPQQTGYCRCFYTEMVPRSIAYLLVHELVMEQNRITIDVARRDNRTCAMMRENVLPSPAR